MFELYVVMVFMIIGAVVAVRLRGLLSSVIAVGAVGLGLCVMFLLLRAPDLAITQLVVEILCLVILIRATIGRGISRLQPKANRWILAAFVIFAAGFLYAAYLAIRQVPDFGGALMSTSQFYIANTLSKVKAANIVSAIILDFRGYDTLGEATVLFTSVIAVLAVMRRKGRKKIDERDEPNS